MNSGDSIPNRPRTISEGGKRLWIYPTETRGRFQNIRVAIAIVLVAFFYALPWLTWNDVPLLRLSISSGHFNFLGKVILVREFYHFAFLFILAALTLFLMSATLGRVWCGYGCPQTIFIEQILRRIERLIEGDAFHRKQVDSKPMSASKLFKKTFKQICFLAVALSFGLTATSFFADPVRVFGFQHFHLNLTVGIFTALAWFDGAYLREQFCHILCPYARFQSVMLSRSALTIGYDEKRGEPRRKGKARDGAGDCIDCGLCVRVCPAGIDIRQGVNQLECIACARCIDACDTVMTNIDKPKGLIRYDNEFGLSNEDSERKRRISPFKNQRVYAFSVAWVVLFSVGLYQFAFREQFHLNWLSIPGTPFVVDNGRVKNVFTLKIGNQDDHPATFDFSINEERGFKIESPTHLGPIAPGEERGFPILISFPVGTSTKDARVTLKTVDGGYSKSWAPTLIAPGAAK